MSQSGGGTQDTEILYSRADLGKYINSVDTLSNDQKYQLLTQPFVPSKHYRLTSMGKTAPFGVVG